MCGEFPWKADGVRPAAKRFGRVLKFHNNATAQHPPCQRERKRRWQQAKRQSDPHTTKITRHALNSRGANAIPTTGEYTAASTRSTPSETVHSNVNATNDDANA